MNIHFLIAKDVLHGGGIEKYTREVGSRLVARGHDVTVYSTEGPGPRVESLNGMRIVWLSRTRPHWAEKTAGALAAALHELRVRPRPDVIHLHSVAAGSMAFMLRSRVSPCVVQMHGVEWMRSRWGPLGRAVLLAMENASLRAADAFTAVSRTQCQFYSARYGVEMDYIPNGAELKPYIAAREILARGIEPQRYILFAARLVAEKGAHYLISAFRQLSTDCSLIIAGDGLPEYVGRLRQLADGDCRIRFVGHVSGSLLEELLCHARIFVQPSELEGMSIGLLEAMSYGLPCIASDIPENQEVTGLAALQFRSGDIASLTAALSWALEHPEGAAEIGRAARDRVAAQFSWDRVIDQLVSLYRRTTRLGVQSAPACVGA
jgi:glycosyltransferase involved in cell wall biosynthesis